MHKYKMYKLILKYFECLCCLLFNKAWSLWYYFEICRVIGIIYLKLFILLNLLVCVKNITEMFCNNRNFIENIILHFMRHVFRNVQNTMQIVEYLAHFYRCIIFHGKIRYVYAYRSTYLYINLTSLRIMFYTRFHFFFIRFGSFISHSAELT